MLSSPRGLKRSRYGNAMSDSLRQSTGLRIDKDRQTAIPAIANKYATNPPPQLAESDDMVLRTDSLMAQLHADAKLATSPLPPNRTAQQLGRLWQSHSQIKSQSGSIGPKSNSGLDKANYLAQLALRLHHPFSASANAPSAYRPSAAYSNLVMSSGHPTSIPRALLDWLNTYHNPFPDDLKDVMRYRPTPVAHDRFWDMVYACTLRGDVLNAINLLETADWSQAESAIEDGYDQPGYAGSHLHAVREVVSRCVDLLSTCPAVTENDWDVKGSDWTIFRHRVRRELQDLQDFAEADSRDKDQFPAAPFGRVSMSFSTASRRAESKVPWLIYESLKTLYGQLLGKRDEIMVATQDWLEAVIFLTAWWDGEDDDIMSDDFAASRRSMRQSQSMRQVDVSPVFAYKKQLLLAFASVTDKPDEDEFYLNTVNPVQVGIACICEDDTQGLVGILKSWSLPIASAIVELATAAGWMPSSASNILDAFDQDDLMVLSHGQPVQSDLIKRDDVLIQYASVLAKKDSFKSATGKPVQEGWDLACRVLGRLDSFETAKTKISDLLNQIALDSTTRVDKVLAVLNEIGLPDQVCEIAERYADDLAASSQDYGSALIYYARAHASQKLRSTIDLLISLCLVQSAAFPPQAIIDPQLDALLNDQHATLHQVARQDVAAAQLLASQLSGYATLRRFYDLRDADAAKDAAEADPGMLRPLARKREAARALMAVIESAADSIRGGLYDPEAQSVVQVDALMALLCEALPLMNQTKQILKTPHLLTLIRAIEDLETITPGIYAQNSAVFSAAINSYLSNSSSPTTLTPSSSTPDLSKSIAGLKQSVSWNMVKSSGSIASEQNGNGGDSSAGVMGGYQVQRAWDWRVGAVHMKGKAVQPKDVMRVLRCQVAVEMGKVWM
ncbi:hypothetical protein M436DRAFT_35060 [Aureobasidium namibiae CBS 147.97]|uniref:Nuclear pore complex protein Nup85 n=1 Tax=Aureobasidium namibiae CBS 147.97 TaxID=1043004 RepID=A0A074XSG7_9PEZI|nr:uncharacterized protein M436DRAFT_35060 [Aureobasidium namibiae CBS 147.97]KEQ77516.1 hypothetical protein M436DRAFT_35060 [Aureobasidium namibiae CBS 147.97]